MMEALHNRRGWTRFAWVRGDDGYIDPTPFLARRVAPVILPADKTRKEQWTKVLAWYGLRETDASVGLDRLEHSVAHGRHWIVAVGSEYAESASFYASACGRPFCTVSSIDGIGATAGELRAVSILLVGAPRALSASVTTRLSAQLDIPWGILTARDPAGISFLVAKLLAASVRHPAAVVDGENDRLLRIECNEGVGDWMELSAGQLLRAVSDEDWSTLGFWGHGADGSHLRLRGFSLCGLVGEYERDRDGQRLVRCHTSDGQLRCVTDGSENGRAVRFGALRAQTLYLGTCNGYAVADEFFPSDASAVLASVDGYPRAILTTDRPVAQPRINVEMRVASLADGRPPGLSQSLENDWRQYTFGSRPMILVGDPAADGPPPTGAAVAVMALGQLAAAEVVDAGPGIPHAARSAHHVTLYGRRAPETAFVDASERYRAHVAWVNELYARVQNVAAIERAIPRTSRARFERSTPFQERLLDLVAVRVAVEQRLQEVAALLADVRRAGLWSSDVDAAMLRLAKETSTWDVSFAESLLEHAFNSPFQMLLIDGFVREKTHDVASCPCGGRRKATRYASLYPHLRPRTLVECERTGFTQAWVDEGSRLEVDLSRSVRGGETLSASVTWSLDAVRDPTNATPLGWLVGEIVDGINFVPLARVKEHMSREPRRFDLVMPRELPAALHLCLFAWVSTLDVAFVKALIPGLPARKRDLET